MEYIIKTAFEIAQRAHKGQKDKAGQPYISHPIRVSESVHTDEEKAVALLHDVIEDSEITLTDLRAHGLPDAVVDAVDCMTKRKGESYESYLWRVKSNLIARVVKIADMEHNSDLSRLPHPSSSDYERLEKYRKGLEFLRR